LKDTSLLVCCAMQRAAPTLINHVPPCWALLLIFMVSQVVASPWGPRQLQKVAKKGAAGSFCNSFILDVFG
jgi:hypothetical protein